VEGARVCLAGLQRVLDGREALYELEYPCHAPDKQRWFLLRAAPLRRSAGGAVVAHFDITARHVAEQSLRQELHASTELIKAMPAGLFIYERRPPDHLVLIDANPEAEWLTGATLERWLGEEFDALWPQARHKGITQALLEVLEGGEVYETDDHYYSDERLNKCFRLRAFRVGRHRLGLAVEDFTEQRRAEQALRDSEERFRTLVQNVPGVVYLCRKDARSTMLYLSENVVELTGRPAEVFLKQKVSFLDLYHPLDAKQIRPQIDAALAQRRSFSLTYRLRHTDESYRWVEEHGQGVFDADGSLRFLEGTMVDVTERKEADEALRRTTTMLNNILASSSEYAIVATDADLRVTHFNPTAERLFQMAAADVLGKAIADIHEEHSVCAEKFADALRSVEETGKWEGVLQIRHQDGQMRHIRPVVTPMLDDSGKRVGLVILARDITDRVIRSA
jgi:PAS domain S-box-containing protein